MAKKRQNVEIWQGEDKILRFHIEDEDVNLSGATGVWRMANKNSMVAVISKSGASVVVNSSDRYVDVVLDSADTIELPPRRYHHQLRIEDGSGNRNKGAVGDVILHETIPEPE